MPAQSRRKFVRSFLAATAAVACSSPSAPDAVVGGGGSARLTARPKSPSTATSPGKFEITPGAVNDGYLVVPSSYKPGKPLPLVLGLHGAGSLAQSQVNLLGPSAESRGFHLLAVGSRG